MVPQDLVRFSIGTHCIRSPSRDSFPQVRGRLKINMKVVIGTSEDRRDPAVVPPKFHFMRTLDDGKVIHQVDLACLIIRYDPEMIKNPGGSYSEENTVSV